MVVFRFGNSSGEVSNATFELFNLFSPRPDWVLDATCDGVIPHLRLAGTVRAPALPGPTALDVAYVDDPRLVTIGGEQVVLAKDSAVGQLYVRRVDIARVRIEGELRIGTLSAAAGDAAIHIALDAALVT